MQSEKCVARCRNEAARRTLVGIELMHMMKKKQGVGAEDNDAPSAAEQFYSLTVEAPHRQGQPALSSLLSKMCDGTQPHP